MDLRYRLHRIAFNELDGAILYYNQKGGKRLAVRFLKEYRKLRERILKNPFQFGEVENDYRQAIFKSFPYVIVYYPFKNEVFVLAVFHTSRNPDDWKSRK